jgi:membrane associated rhomboid family serine protease
MSGLSSSPLVGASAAVSGLMALVAMGSWLNKERLRYFFMLLPMRPYFGFAYLPAWLVLVVYSLPDVSGYLGSSNEFGSVAYSAHLGGAAFGAVIAFAFFRGWLVRDAEDDSDLNDEHSEPRHAKSKDDHAA